MNYEISKYWLSEWFLEKPTSSGQYLNALKLAWIKKNISNFVNVILSESKNVTVNFLPDTQAENEQIAAYGYVKQIKLLSTNIQNKEKNIKNKKLYCIYINSKFESIRDIDINVGLVLHEASHVRDSNFKIIEKENLYNVIKPITKIEILTQYEKDLIHFFKNICNFIEDLYIDQKTQEIFPGYTGYYDQLYDYFYNNSTIKQYLQSREKFCNKTLFSYEFRIIFLYSPHAILDALPNLIDIKQIINRENILRLKTPSDRIKVAKEIYKIVLSNIITEKDFLETNTNILEKSLEKLKPFFDNKTNTNYNHGEKPIEKVENNPLTSLNNFNEKVEKSKEIKDVIDFLNQKYYKNFQPLNEHDQKIINSVNIDKCKFFTSKHKITSFPEKKINSILFKSVTVKDFENDFSLLHEYYFPSNLYTEYIKKGIRLGAILSKRIRMAFQESSFKEIGLMNGKICKRKIYSGVYKESIFEKNILYSCKKICIHISVDCSGSMTKQNKWGECVKLISAFSKLCYDISLNNKIHLSISLRNSLCLEKHVGDSEVPIVAIIYDSYVNGVKHLCDILEIIVPTGGTPEGLCFESLNDIYLKDFFQIGSKNIFINISDGIPDFFIGINNMGEKIYYAEEVAALHTRKVIKKFEQNNVYVYSYLIQDNKKENEAEIINLFKKMYGKQSFIIDYNSMQCILKTVQKIFLTEQKIST